MPTIIDSLVISLGLDPSGFEKGRKQTTEGLNKTKKEAQATAKAIEAEGKRAAEFFVGMRNEALKFFAVMAGGVGITQFTANMGKAVISMGALSQATGVAIEDISAWEGAFKRAGASAADADGLIQGLAKAKSDFETGHPGDEWQILRILGISSPDELNDINGSIYKISAGLKRVKDQHGGGVAAGYAAKLGITDPKAFAALASGDDALAGYVASALKAGVVTDEQYKKMLKANEGLQAMKDAWSKVALNLQVSLIPIFEKVTKFLNWLAAWAQKNPGIIKAGFIGIASAVLLMNVALLPQIALFAAIAAGVAAVSVAVKWLIDDYNKFREGASKLDWTGMSDALKNVAGAWGELSSAVKGVIDHFAPGVWDGIGDSITKLANGAIKLLVGGLNGVADAMRAIAGLAKGQTPSAAASAAVAAPSGPQLQRRPPAPTGDAVGLAKDLLRRKEGFAPKAYWDVNAYRAGFGSDTVTDPRTGAITKVTRNTVVTRDQAEADLARRAKASLDTAKRQLGSRWAGLTPSAQAALASVAYNYGSLPARVTGAKDLAAAVEGLKNDNGGVNSKRRMAEAAMMRGLPASGANLRNGMASNDNRTTTVTTTVGQVVVNTQATDAVGMAQGAGAALQKYAFVPQANIGYR